MIALFPVALAVVAAGIGLHMRTVVDPLEARALSSRWAGYGLIATAGATAIAASGADRAVLATLPWHATLLPPGLLASVPLVTVAAAWLTFSLAPSGTHPPRVLASIWGLFSASFAFVIAGHPVLLAVLWAVSAALVSGTLASTRRDEGLVRLFNIYHLPGVALFCFGAYLVGSGREDLGVPCLLLAIGIREATIPLHSWFPRMVEAAPLGLVVAFVGPQLGVYAQLELLAVLHPGALAHDIASVGAITAVLGAAMAVAQHSARRAIAYMIMSQTGLVAFGLDSDSAAGRTGALLTWQILALCTTGLVMTLAALEARRGNHDLGLREPQGNFAAMPRLAVAFLLFGFASVGFPLTLGFAAEDLLVQGSVDSSPILGIGLIVATALNGITVMRAFFMLFTGTEQGHGQIDLTPRERRPITVVGAAILVAGLLPAPLVALGGTEDSHPPLPMHGAAIPAWTLPDQIQNSDSASKIPGPLRVLPIHVAAGADSR